MHSLAELGGPGMLAGTVMCGPTHWLARGHHDEVEAGADTLVDTARRQVTRADRTDDSDVARTIVHRWLAHVRYSEVWFTHGIYERPGF